MHTEEWREPTEGQLAARSRLLEHVDWRLRPPAWFYRQLEDAIELAAAGKRDEMVELDSRRYTAGEVVADWDLEEFVERFGEEPPESPYDDDLAFWASGPEPGLRART